MPPSTIGRYNLPTCTLEVRTKNVPLLGWFNRSKGENIYFELYFDDPKATKTEKVIISGDREKLQQLSFAVNNYVQKFLALNSEDLSNKIAKESSFTNNTYNPSLQSKNLLAHELFLGSLATEESGKQIELSPLQLFDLATALDKYSTDNMVAGKNFSQKSTLNFTLKKKIAAASILLLGLAAIASRIFTPLEPQSQTISQSSQNEAAESNLKVDRSFEVLSPPIPENPPPPKPSLSSQETANLARQSQSLPQQTTQPQPPPPPKSQAKPEKIQVNQSPQINPKLPPLPPLKSDRAIESNRADRDSLAKRNNDNEMAILAEVNNYLKPKWQPIKDLNRDLQYRLIVDRNGSLISVIPLGYPAKIYRDRTGIPSPGETFISPFDNREILIIRVFLIPDGSVKTFLESTTF